MLSDSMRSAMHPELGPPPWVLGGRVLVRTHPHGTTCFPPSGAGQMGGDVTGGPQKIRKPCAFAYGTRECTWEDWGLELLAWERPISHWVQQGPLLIVGYKMDLHYQEWRGWDWGSRADCLPSMHTVLSLNPSSN